jgi:HAD superfamily hydrolase (TIGR01509 family)
VINVQALIFDMDGLMIDSERLYMAVEREIAEGYGASIKDSTLWKMMGRSPLESMRIMAGESGINEDPEILLRARDSMMLQRLREDLVPMKGLYQCLKWFHGKISLAIATGSASVLLEQVLQTLGIREMFSVLMSSDAVQRGKPDPEIYLETADRLAVNPGDCVVLEDSENGANAAAAAGCHVVAVPSKYTKRHDFSRADHVAENLICAGRYIAGISGLEISIG